MTRTVLISQKVASEFATELRSILEASPRPIALLPFTREMAPTPAQIDSIEAAYYSRDIWEGTSKSTLSPAAQAFWPLVEHAPHLKWLTVFSSGTDHPQYESAMARGIRLTTSAGAQAEPVAIAAVTGLLALARRLPHWFAAQQRGAWTPLLGAEVPPDLRGQSVVIVGTGYIGATIARVLQTIGMKTIGIRRRVRPTDYFDEVVPLQDLDALLPTCDWLVLACPLTPETRGLIDARRLALLRPSAGFVNIARGEIVDEAALAAALAGGRLGRAYLDVFTTEPLSPDSPLWKLPNVLISPHNAGASTGTYARGVHIFLRNLERYLNDRPLENAAERQ